MRIMLFLLALILSAPASEAMPVKLLLTGDMHGMVLPRRQGDLVWGGAAEMLQQWKTQEDYQPGRFLVIANGDVATNGALYSTLLNGAPAIDAMNALKYDVCNLGNHEFDMGEEGFLAWKKRASFPFISANLEKQGKRWDVVPPYLIINQSGVKVGILGLMTLDLNEKKNRPTALPLAATIRRYVPEMRSQGAQVVIVAAHEGVQELAKVAYEVRDLNIPLFLGAHWHDSTRMEAGASTLVSAGEWYNEYARIELDYNPTNHTTLVRSVRHEKVYSQRPVADKPLAKMLEAWKQHLPNGRATAPRVVIPHLPVVPIVDGVIQPEEWQVAAQPGGLVIPGTTTAATPPTQAWIGVKDGTLFVAFRCDTVPGAAPQSVAKERDGSVWEDDSMELFIWPDERRSRFWQFIVNAAGTRFDSGNQFDIATTSQVDTSWNPEYAVKTAIEDGAWSIEMAIPLAALGLKAGQEFRLNYTRNTTAGNVPAATWSPLPMGNFHIPTYFGVATIGTR